ncbi:hypothetical protein [Streptomyces sp. RPT161]|uniref:hypothetical protein n=1 Tax=Streptomyces sp. RPT161 TaxID=3015993 RepID=UPI0022B864DF|nr:hypothetical protein [Streptomyces sp. RPT161]
MRSTQLRNVATAVAVVAALGTVSACGGGKSNTGAQQAGAPSGGQQQPVIASAISDLLKVKSSTDKAHSAKVDAEIDQGQLGKTHQSGAVDWSDGYQGDVTITPEGGSVAGAMGMNEARYTKDALYMRMGGKSGGDHWLQYPYAELDKQGANGKAIRQQMQSGSPNQTVLMLIASGDVKVVGKETVRGVETTHYSGLVDAGKLAADTTPGLSPTEQDQLKQQLHDDGVTSDQIDIWVNGDNLLVKKLEQVHTPTSNIRQEIYYSDYGVKVNVTPPPASQTTDVADITKQAQNLGN